MVFSTDAYTLALSSIQWTDLEKEILIFQYQAAEHTISAHDLARHLGYSDYQPASSLYGRIGRKVAEFLQADLRNPPDFDSRTGSPYWFSYLSVGVYQRPYLWIMYPALAHALERSAWVSPNEHHLSEEEVSDLNEGGLQQAYQRQDFFLEGGSQKVIRTLYERSSAARQACIAHHGARCEVCGLDFAKRYGPIDEGFIHVHHLDPLNLRGGKLYSIDPVEDLRPVCPNCHAMLHRKSPPYTIEELRQMLR